LPEVPAAADDHRSHYQGRNFLRLLLAMGLPVFVLYCRIVASIAAERSRSSPSVHSALLRTESVCLILYFVVQLVCAVQLQKMFRKPANRGIYVLQYLGALLIGVLFSVCSAAVLEAFGYELLLRGGRYTQTGVE
jgi:amino acid transporter